MALNTQGKVSTTGIMNQTGTNYQVPDMSNLKVEQPKAPTNINRPVNTQSIEDPNKIKAIKTFIKSEPKIKIDAPKIEILIGAFGAI